jgi:hypothetical protein
MRHLRGSQRDGRRERGQILVLFEIVLIMILGFAAMVIDLGVLRNNRQILVNALDSAALAGASMLPVDNATPGHTVAETEAMIKGNIKVNYSSLVLGVDYTITYRCLIRADVVTGAPLIAVDLPGMCDPHNALHHTPPLYAVPGDFTGAGKQRVSACNPAAGDRCNVVVVKGSSTTQFALTPAIPGAPASGSTGTIVSAACKGACGESTIVPVDLVIILDRTRSMADNFNQYNENPNGVKIHNLQGAAEAILNVYDPAKQRVALALTGPGVVDAAGDPTLGTCPDGGTAYGAATNNNFFPHTTLSGASTTLGSAATTVNAPKTNLGGPVTTLTAGINNRSTTRTIPVAAKTGFPTTFPFTIQIDSEQMSATADGSGTSWTVTRAVNGTTLAAHSSGATVGTPNYINASATTITVTSKIGFPTTYPFIIQIDSEQMTVTGSPSGTTWTVTRGTPAAAHASGAVAILLITATSTALPVTSALGFPTSGNYTVKVDNEQMSVTGGQGTTLWTVQRGQGGTTQLAHANGASVSWDVDNADTTIYVASEAGFPDSGNFSIQIENEQMKVTGGQGTTLWTVQRGQGGTTAAVHAGGKAVNMVVGKNDTTIRVASAIGFPATGNYIIQVDSERMQVGSVSDTSTPTTVMNVTRGVSGTTAATHTSGKQVTNWTSWDPSTYNPSDPSSHTAGVWVPVGLSGTDTDTPLPNPNGAAGTYEVGGVFNTATPLVKAINCISAQSGGTTLSMPLAYAHWYLDTYGRPGVTKGILLETDGNPENSQDFNDASQFTCAAAIAAGNAAKAGGIKVYAVGYGLGQGNNNGRCTDMGLTGEQLLKQVASGTEAPYYFNSPTGSDLAAYFQQIAINLANGGSHLLQLYPVPVVDTVTSTSISGEYFTGADSVKFGAASATIGSVSDTSISITLPSGLVPGQTYQVVVTTPGGSSYLTSASEYTYPGP